MPNTHWNPSDMTAGMVLSNLNLTATSGGSNEGVRSVDRQTTGKYYFEVTETTWNGCSVGVVNGSAALSNATGANGCVVIFTSGLIFLNGSNTGTSIGATANGNVIGIALDLTGGLLWFRIAPSGNWNGNAGFSPGGTGGVNISGVVSSGLYAYEFFQSASQVATANFGDSAFSGAVPSGFASGFPGAAAAASQARAMVLA